MTREEITFDEFKQFVKQLIIDKKGQLPDVQDWKQIKNMMDRVETEPKPKTIFTFQGVESRNSVQEPLGLPTAMETSTNMTPLPPSNEFDNLIVSQRDKFIKEALDGMLTAEYEKHTIERFGFHSSNPRYYVSPFESVVIPNPIMKVDV